MPKLTDLTTHGEVLAEFQRDPAFRAEWERTALARAFAIELIRYRAEHDLSQAELAKRLDVKQPQVARWEVGEKNPTFETLLRVVGKLGIEFAIDITPAKREPALMTKTAQRKASTHATQGSGVSVLVATAMK
jgi:DNA-binding transcriptional regulator YiaG